jgi:phenol 2-monooxygenase
MYVIPRERKVVRFYVQLEEVELNEHGRIDRSQVTPQAIVNAAQKILAPYKLSYKRCEWFTAYQIGRRVGDSYGKFNRVFLAGDAVHTHSPRGGQGMNLSIQDTYNLGWKIGLCVKNTAPRSILQTYESERRQVAKDLIDLDRLAGDPITGKRISGDEFIENIDPVRLGMLSAAFYSGFTVNYDKSILVFKDTEERKGVAWTKDVTNKIVIGMRFPGLQIIRQADASVWSFLHWLKSDGRFRIILFAGNIKEAGQKERIETFCDNLEKEGSFLKRVTPPTARIDSVIEILTLHSSPRAQTDIFDFPSLLRPFDAEKGWDYDKIFVDDETYHYGHGQAYKNYGIDRCSGAAVVVRPDQHVAHVGDIDDIATLERYFAGVLLDAPQGLST